MVHERNGYRSSFFKTHTKRRNARGSKRLRAIRLEVALESEDRLQILKWLAVLFRRFELTMPGEYMVRDHVHRAVTAEFTMQ